MPDTQPRKQGRGRKTDRNDADRFDKQSEALALRRDGLSLRAIATRLGIAPNTAKNYIDGALKALVAENLQSASELRELERARLEQLLATYTPKALQGDEKAADRVIKISEIIAKLYGLNAPVQTETSGEIVVKVAYDGADDLHR